MRLTFRRARSATMLLLAATGAALIAAVIITGLVGYSRDVLASGARSAVLSAPPEERSVLVRGPFGHGSQAMSRDADLRALIVDGLGGRPAAVSAAGYAVGRELLGDVGAAIPDQHGTVYASAVFLDDLAEHADLASGTWGRPGAVPSQVTLAEAAAATLGVASGERISIGDRRTGEVTEVVVAGIWRPRELSDPYWLLTPGVDTGVAAHSSSYGPIVLSREDFLRGWAADASAAWIIRPDATGAELAELVEIERGALALADVAPQRLGLGDSAIVTTQIDRLVDRLKRADLVGRSTLLTPVLLIAVLGGYALILIALLLNEDRRNETALMRARGAARRQIAGLAAREAVLVVLPAALLAPILVAEVLRYLNRAAPLADASLRLDASPSAVSWLVSGAAALGCVIAMLGPAMRRAGTYVEELASRSRPGRWAFAQRAGIDLLLVVFAVLAWTQLRQYSSPLVGARGDLGIDPLLSAGPTVAVLAGGVLALRALPRITGAAERYVDRKPWTATMLGMWQAGRRPNAGPVLLLALSIAVSTLALCLASTAERSVRDQADFMVGADLRLVEANGFSPPGRPAQVAALPGTAGVLPVQRDVLRLGTDAITTALVAIDSDAAADVMRYRDDLIDGSPADLFARMARSRGDLLAIPLPVGARRLTGTITVGPNGVGPVGDVQTSVVLAGLGGLLTRISLGSQRAGGTPVRFDLELPDNGRQAPAVVAFNVSTIVTYSVSLTWTLEDLSVTTATGARAPVDLSFDDAWVVLDGGERSGQGSAGSGTLTAELGGPPRQTCTFRCSFFGSPVGFALVPSARPPAVPVVATPDVLRALRIGVGETTRLNVLGGQIEVRVIDEVRGVPGTSVEVRRGDGGGMPSALLADLPALSHALFRNGGIVAPGAQEFWVTATPSGSAAAAAAAGRLPGLRVLDRRTIADAASKDPYGVGARTGLLAAAGGAMLLALLGIAVDVRATARRRIRELAVMHTLGAGPRLLARALIAEQFFLAGMGVVVGVGVGVAVAATMAPLLILSPSADRPVPEPLLQVAWGSIAAAAGLLLLLALGLSGLVATTMRGRLTAAQLRIGED